MKKTLIACVIVALVAGGGSAVAASKITSSDIANGTIKLADMSKSAKRGLKGNRGPTGLSGPSGPQGPAGPSAVGASNLVTSAEVPYDPSDVVQFAIAFCPPGQRVLSGGGANIGDEQLAISMPTGDRSGWAVAGVDLIDNGGEYVQAFAICAPAGQAVAAGVRSKQQIRRAFAKLAAKVAPAGTVRR